MRVYRVANARYAANSSDGARLAGGRWNKIGTPVIYSSASASLTSLEVIVHLGAVPEHYRLIEISIPEALKFNTIDVTTLPTDWNNEESIPRTAAMGTAWAQSLATAVLKVPSAVIRSEFNYLLNPLHPDFERILFEVYPENTIDERLRAKRV